MRCLCKKPEIRHQDGQIVPEDIRPNDVRNSDKDDVLNSKTVGDRFSTHRSLGNDEVMEVGESKLSCKRTSAADFESNGNSCSQAKRPRPLFKGSVPHCPSLRAQETARVRDLPDASVAGGRAEWATREETECAVSTSATSEISDLLEKCPLCQTAFSDRYVMR